MQTWNIKYWSDENGKKDVEIWLDSLLKEELRAITKKIKLLEICGNNLRMPHSRPLNKGLFELRDLRYGLRIYYAFDKGQLIILLAAGDKSSQKNDIKIARERLKEIIEEKS